MAMTTKKNDDVQTGMENTGQMPLGVLNSEPMQTATTASKGKATPKQTSTLNADVDTVAPLVPHSENEVGNTEKLEKPSGSLVASEKPKLPKNASERFTNQVLFEFGSEVSGKIQVTDYQRQLIQGYFIVIDRAIKDAEERRSGKNNSNNDHKYDVNLPVTWEHVNLPDLAKDLVHYARMGLDMAMPNMLFPVPYRNKRKDVYDITLTPGYNGIKYIAEKYAQRLPVNVTIELVHKEDTFRALKKSMNQPVESYVFEITNPFERGEIIGGFGYIEFENKLENKLVIMTRHDIDKRKPKTAAAEFWGGSKWEYVGGKRVEVNVEGWQEEMCRKTLIREVYSAKHLPTDPQKVDDNYQYMKARETQYAELAAAHEAKENANTIIIDTTELPEGEAPQAATYTPPVAAATQAAPAPSSAPTF